MALYSNASPTAMLLSTAARAFSPVYRLPMQVETL